MTYVVSRMWDQIKDALLLLHRALLRWFNGTFLKAMFDNYHPEQHYMRGFWAEKSLNEFQARCGF